MHEIVQFFVFYVGVWTIQRYYYIYYILVLLVLVISMMVMILKIALHFLSLSLSLSQIGSSDKWILIHKCMWYIWYEQLVKRLLHLLLFINWGRLWWCCRGECLYNSTTTSFTNKQLLSLLCLMCKCICMMSDQL